MKKAGPGSLAPLFSSERRRVYRERSRGWRIRRKKMPRSIVPTPIIPRAGRIVAVLGAMSPASAASPAVINGSGLADSPFEVRENGSAAVRVWINGDVRIGSGRARARTGGTFWSDVGGVRHRRECLRRAGARSCGRKRGRMMEGNHGGDESCEESSAYGVCDSTVFSARRAALAFGLRRQLHGRHHQYGGGRSNLKRGSSNERHQSLRKMHRDVTVSWASAVN